MKQKSRDNTAFVSECAPLIFLLILIFVCVSFPQSIPTNIQNSTFQCVSNWNCTGYSNCSANGTQTRTCTDLNNCSNPSNTRTDSQVCVPTPVACFPNWSCTDYSNCSVNNTETRTCTDTNGCNNTTSEPAESKGCIFPQTQSNTTLVVFIIVFIVEIGTLAYFGMDWFKNKRSRSPPLPPPPSKYSTNQSDSSIESSIKDMLENSD